MDSAEVVKGETESVKALVHGVYAITMTLLILDLRVPPGPGSLLHKLGAMWPQFAAYGYGFMFLAATWLRWRGALRRLSGTTEMGTMLSFVHLGLISLTPFTVRVVADSIDKPADFVTAVQLMSVVTFAAYFMRVTSWRYSARRSQGPAAKALLAKSPVTMYVISCVGPVLAFGLAFLTPWLSLVVLTADVLKVLIFDFDPHVNQIAETDVAKVVK